MILIVGGEGAGKRDFARTLGFTDAQIGQTPDFPVVLHAENLVKTQEDVLPCFEVLKEKPVVIVNEVGSGIIPAEREKTVWRESAGRLSVLLAKEAACVVRVVCGIPTVIKGEL